MRPFLLTIGLPLYAVSFGAFVWAIRDVPEWRAILAIVAIRISHTVFDWIWKHWSDEVEGVDAIN